MRDAIQQACN